MQNFLGLVPVCHDLFLPSYGTLENPLGDAPLTGLGFPLMCMPLLMLRI
jgi:hypothetical protein